jgi:hypothetical protein
MILVPGDTPVTTPVPEIVATVGVPLIHTPPVVALASVVVLPVHTVKVPVMGNGLGLTLTVIETEHEPIV